MVRFMSRYDIMHEHDNQRDTLPPLQGAFLECRMYRYVAIIEGLNHSLKKVWRDYKEITLFRQWKDIGQERDQKRYLPAEKYPYLLLRFYDTYSYYIYT